VARGHGVGRRERSGRLHSDLNNNSLAALVEARKKAGISKRSLPDVGRTLPFVAKYEGREARRTIVAVRRVRTRATRRVNKLCRRLRCVLVVFPKSGGTGAKCAMVAPVRLARDRGGFGFVAPIRLCELAHAYAS
jgi:hypothetical protein